MSTDLAESTGVTNPLILLQSMVERGVNPDALKQMMDLAERWQANQAAQAFADAITGFQSECPTVFKSRTAAGGARFAFASYDDVMREAGPILARYRIVPTFTTEPSELGLKCTCRIRVGVHVEETTITVPIPASIVNSQGRDVVNGTMLYGQAVSYAKRYALCAALNIVVTDQEDRDAAGLECIDAEELAELRALIQEKVVDLKRFLDWAQIESLEEMPRSQYPKAIDLLKRKARTQ